MPAVSESFLAWISFGEAEEFPAPDRHPEAGATAREPQLLRVENIFQSLVGER
jgi:hypothetical protein